MKRKKTVWLICIICTIGIALMVAAAAVLSSIRRENKAAEQEEVRRAQEIAEQHLRETYDEPTVDYPEELAVLPDGFVSVETIRTEYGDILWFESFEDAFCAIDLDYVCIWQTKAQNRSGNHNSPLILCPLSLSK